MAKSIPGKEFKAAVKALNKVLKADKKEIIKLSGGAKKEDVVISFTEAILEYIEADKVEKLPDEVIDFYNDYVVEAEEEVEEEAEEEVEEEAEEAEEEEKPKKKTKAKAKGKASEKKKEPKKKGPGIVELTVKEYMENGITTKDGLVEEVGKSFPDRNISKTVSHVYGVLKHITPYKK